MLQYTYTATGQKIRQQLVHQEGRVSNTRDYAGSFVYVNNELVKNQLSSQLHCNSPEISHQLKIYLKSTLI